MKLWLIVIIIGAVTAFVWYIDHSGQAKAQLVCETENSKLKDEIREYEDGINEIAALFIKEKATDAERIDHLAKQVTESEQHAPVDCPVVGIPVGCIQLLNTTIEGDNGLPQACTVPKIPAGTNTHLSLARFIDHTITVIKGCRTNIKQIEAVNVALDHAGL